MATMKSFRLSKRCLDDLAFLKNNQKIQGYPLSDSRIITESLHLVKYILHLYYDYEDYCLTLESLFSYLSDDVIKSIISRIDRIDFSSIGKIVKDCSERVPDRETYTKGDRSNPSSEGPMNFISSP